MQIKELKHSYDEATKILRKIKLEYSILDPYLVISSYAGQSPLTDNGLDLLRAIPSAFVDCELRKELFLINSLIKEIESHTKNFKSHYAKDLKDKLVSDLNKHLLNAELMESTTIELRFGQLDYDLIDCLKREDFIDQALTNKHKSSIRIVIGTIANLKRKNIRSTEKSFSSPNSSIQPNKYSRD